MPGFRPSPSMLVAIVAVVLSVTGSAVAAKLITGGQVKDGSITARDLSKAVRTQLAKTGAPGARGLVGPSGPPGLAGVSGTNATIAGASAGGALAGTFPNPTLAAGSVGTDQVADGSLTPADSGPVPVLSLFGGSDGPVQVANATTVVIPWDDDVLANVVDIDTDDMHSYTLNPADIRSPRAGIYSLSALVNWDAAATGAGTRELRFQVVGQGFSSRLNNLAGSTESISETGTATIRLAEGDIVRISVRQTSGMQLSARGNHVSLRWVGP